MGIKIGDVGAIPIGQGCCVTRGRVVDNIFNVVDMDISAKIVILKKYGCEFIAHCPDEMEYVRINRKILTA